MIAQTLLRFSAGLLCLWLAGCSVLETPLFQRQTGPSHSVLNPCRLNPQSCMYDGQYEKGERQFAEDEAKRLNRASLERLRRQSVL